MSDGELLSELLLRLRPHDLTIGTITFPSGLRLNLLPASPEVLSPAEQREKKQAEGGVASRMKLP